MSGSHPVLPFLDNLQAVFADLAPRVADQPDAALSVTASRGLLDHLTVQHGRALDLQREALVKVAALIPRLRALLTDPAQTPSVAEIASIASAGIPAGFERVRALSGAIQCGLLALGTADANSLARTFLDIEADYVRAFSAALREQNARTAAAKRTVSAARNSRAIDSARLTHFLRGACPDEKDVVVTGSSVVAGGYSKFTAVISLAGTRTLPAELIMRGDAAATFGGISVTEEFRIIEIAHRHGVPVPRPFAVDEAGSVLGAPFMLVEKKVGGYSGNSMDPPQLADPALNAAYAAAVASVHRVPLEAFAGRLRGADCRNSDWALGWVDEAERAFRPLGLPAIAWETAFEWLRRNARLYDAGPRGLVHGDYSVNNVLADGPRVSAILDWEFAHAGNTTYDLGYFHPMAVPLGGWRPFLDAYANAGGPLGDEKQLNYSILLAATRIGVMLLQTQEQLYGGKDTGLAAAIPIARDYYGLAETRVADALNHVL